MYALADIQNFNWDVISGYKKTYRESKAYTKYIQSHPAHTAELEELLSRIEGYSFYKNKDSKTFSSQKATKIENMVKKIKFYQKDQGKYSIPADLVSFVEIKDEATLKDKVRERIINEMAE